MPTKHSYAQILETNQLIRHASDLSLWLCRSRTAQGSKLFPVPAYMILSYLECFYRYPDLVRRVDAAMPAEEIGDRARETMTSLQDASLGWCLPNFYLLGRQLLIDMGMLRATDALDDTVELMDFWKRFQLAYHRADGHLTKTAAGHRGQVRSERTLQAFDADLIAMKPGDRLHKALGRFNATVSGYAFLASCECRVQIHNDGPYPTSDGEMVVRQYAGLSEGDFPWLDGVADAIEYPNLVVPMVLGGTHVYLLDDWGNYDTEPVADHDNVLRAGLYSSDHLSGGYIPVAMGSAAELAEKLEELRDQFHEATTQLWQVFAGYTRDQLLDAGALLYYNCARDLAKIAGIYDHDEFFTLDERTQRFKGLMNDEYGRDSLTELIALLTLPSQQVHDYTLGMHSDAPAHMSMGIPYSVLADDDFTATMGPANRKRWSSLPKKTGLWTTTRGKMTLEELNAASRACRPPIEDPRLRYLDDLWVKWHAGDPRADELYRIAQEHSSLAGAGAGLRRDDLASASVGLAQADAGR
jgi:hypothetical protein